MSSDTNSPESGFDPGAFMQLLQRSWQQAMPGAMGIPPGMSVADLDKRITELRVVEQWLETNLTMLRTTVQALEVQRGTIAALHAFGEKLGAQDSQASESGQAATAAGDAMNAISQAFQQMGDVSQAGLMPWWQGLQQQFHNIATQAAGSGFAGIGTPPATTREDAKDAKGD